MECPICGNKIGFVMGTCIECHYNYLDNNFHKIEVDTDTLKMYVPIQIYNQLVEEHEKHFRR